LGVLKKRSTKIMIIDFITYQNKPIVALKKITKLGFKLKLKNSKYGRI
jgi:hypothetical protein